MPKTFYTEHEIEDLAKQGVSSLVVTDDVVLTDLAREKARRLGVQLLREDDKPPSAPERPYIAKAIAPSAAPAASQPKAAPANKAELQTRVRAAVMAQLGESADAKLLDTIITRVLNSIGPN